MTTFGLASIGRSLDNIGKSVELITTMLVVESIVKLKEYQEEKGLTAEDIEAALAITAIIKESDLF